MLFVKRLFRVCGVVAVVIMIFVVVVVVVVVIVVAPVVVVVVFVVVVAVIVIRAHPAPQKSHEWLLFFPQGMAPKVIGQLKRDNQAAGQRRSWIYNRSLGCKP